MAKVTLDILSGSVLHQFSHCLQLGGVGEAPGSHPSSAVRLRLPVSEPGCALKARMSTPAWSRPPAARSSQHPCPAKASWSGTPYPATTHLRRDHAKPLPDITLSPPPGDPGSPATPDPPLPLSLHLPLPAPAPSSKLPAGRRSAPELCTHISLARGGDMSKCQWRKPHQGERKTQGQKNPREGETK